MTQRMYRSDMSNELWVDASDEWGYLPASCLTPTSSDNTRTSLELPTNDSWSSSDSWASALSDLIQSVSILSEDRPSISIQDMTKEKAMELESSFELGDGDSEGNIQIKDSSRPLIAHREESENRLYTNIDMNRTQDLAVDVDGETQSGLQEEEDECWNDTEGRLENECAYGSEVSSFHSCYRAQVCITR